MAHDSRRRPYLYDQHGENISHPKPPPAEFWSGHEPARPIGRTDVVHRSRAPEASRSTARTVGEVVLGLAGVGAVALILIGFLIYGGFL